MFFQKIYGLQPNTAFWSNTKGRLVDFQTKRVGVPFDGCSRLVRSAQCQIQRPFGRLKLGNPSSALEWMFFPLLRPQMICSLVEQLVRGRGRGMCVPGRSRAGGRTGCSCRASTSARLTNMPRKLAGRVASSPGNSPQSCLPCCISVSCACAARS